MDNKIKLIATDLDGTLLYPKKYISLIDKGNIQFLSDFVKNGGKVVCVTGRNPKLKKKIEKKIKAKITYIGCNGAFTVDENDKLISSYPLDNEFIQQVYYEYMNKFKIVGWMLFSLENRMHFSSNKNKFINSFVKLVSSLRMAYRETLIFNRKKFKNAIENDVNFKLMPVYGLSKKNFDNAYKLSKILKKEYSDKLNVVYSSSSVEITSKQASKSKALLEYIEKLGISKDEVAVIGDSGNDISMFKEFPHSFCMSHAYPRVKSYAMHIVNKVSDLGEYFADSDILEEDIKEFYR